eukprot:TRINITY_DN9657_c0_g1_i1.p1 TRINITY_DN9657_c0_g1~~TRINITY_DN9657_c0_g1_i1.p1  ORF type:complete len:713 (-),score=135.81 TRINITY_DN9657_c0_g1_i1:25-2163(-)
MLSADSYNDPLLSPLLHSASSVHPNSLLEKSWEQLQYDENLPHPSPRSGVGEAYYNRQMIIFGGYHQGQALNDVWTFDLDQLVWREIDTIGEPPAPRTSHSMCLDHERAKLYVLCGSGSVFGSTNLGDVFEFDLLYHTWTKLDFSGDTLFPRYGQTAILFKRKIFIFGGTYGREFCGDFLVLDLESRTCSQLPLKGEFASPRYKHAAVLLPPNKMLVHGGATTQNYRLDDTYLVDLDTLQWARLECVGEIPSGQFAHSLCVSPVTKTVWLFGGCDRLRCMADLYKLESSVKDNNKIWTWKRVKAEKSPPPRYFHACVFDDLKGAVVLWAGKGAIVEQLRFKDVHRISVDNGDRKRIKICTPQCTFASDMIAYLISPEAEELSDLKLACVTGEQFACHKIVLLARCPVLLDLIDEEDCIYLDISSTCLAALVFFLYSGELPDAVLSSVSGATSVSELLRIAHKLNLFTLSLLCQKGLFRMMSEQTAYDAISHLDGYYGLFRDYLESYLSVRRGDVDAQVSHDKITANVIESLNMVPPNTVKNDFLQLFNNPNLSDFSLKVKDVTFHCHLFVLACRSAYFRSPCIRKFMAESIEKYCSFDLPINFPSMEDGENDPSEVDEKTVKIMEFVMKYIYAGEASLDGSIDAEFARVIVRLDLGNFFGFNNGHLQNFCLTQLSRNGKSSRIPQQKLEVPMLTMPAMLWSSFSGMNRFRVK